jgi:hypothetical protein
VDRLQPDARLADSRRSEDRHEVGATLLDHPLPDRCEHRELPISPDHRHRRDGPLPDRRDWAKGEPRANGLLLALRLDRLGRPVLDRSASALVRLLPDENRADRGRGLEAGGRVHDVPRDHRLTVARARLELDDRLARVHRDPDLEALALGPVPHREGRADGPLRVVPVGGRRAEDPHDRVADELLDHSSEPDELGPHALVVRREERADVLGVEGLRLRGESDQVHEEHRDDAPLLADRRRLDEDRTAGVAEAGALRILLCALCAGRHELED